MVTKVAIKTDRYGDINATANGQKFYIMQFRANRGENGYEGFGIHRINDKGNRVFVADADTIEEVRGYLKTL